MNVYRRTPARRGYTGRGGQGGGSCIRIVIGLVVAGAALLSYFGSREFNPVIGEEQYVGITQEQEIALGFQAAPELTAQFGGLSSDAEAQAFVDQIGNELVAASFAAQSDYPYEFNLLGDPQTVNAFALPGGPIFITEALYYQLETTDQLAGVLGHEIGHVVARHSSQQIAKQRLSEGLTGAVVLATYDPDNPSSMRTPAVAALIAQMVNLRYGREDELQSDFLGVCILHQAGYDPLELVQVMEILAAASGGASRGPEFFQTHPNPENRIGRIQEAAQNLEDCPER
jgi:beta-barrel assembly-enhancing protease